MDLVGHLQVIRGTTKVVFVLLYVFLLEQLCHFDVLVACKQNRPSDVLSHSSSHGFAHGNQVLVKHGVWNLVVVHEYGMGRGNARVGTFGCDSNSSLF